ncbi:MAG: hypothetical protein AUK47_23450 [Deltaproteobacteria bacterium CG2_30_63_29]|nr:MAG: hypothetical protein AUK47_23450 [Deltaproteobacteria bacterium CG2_30_63_29]PJB34873.1 MAG: hypothetical protein CO108_27060 [Deltaproteobacteria bacterium CG_4_9_14_3_um_filter_63_12]
MRKRTLLTILLGALMLMIAALIMLVIIIVRARGLDVDTNLVTAEEAKVVKSVRVDPFVGRENDAIAMVQRHEVLDPNYIKQIVDIRKREAEKAAEAAEPAKDKKDKKGKERGKEKKPADGGAPADPVLELTEDMVVKTKVTILSLVEKNYLEDRFKMSFLERGSWRSMQLETDMGDVVNDDPYYEVYLEYHDEDVIVGPVWVANVQTGDVVPRNEFAEIFELDPDNAANAEDFLSRPARVVKAITNHQFPSGIELGGVLLRHFVNRPKEGRDLDRDRIIGWTVSHEFRDAYNAYFQWIEGGKNHVARFRFDWKSQRLEPRGLVAIDLMAEGEALEKANPVSIWPQTYDNNPNIPREARWLGDTAKGCKTKEIQPICNAFAMVLEQQDFIEAVQWLLTENEQTAEKFIGCRDRGECRWFPEAESETADIIKIQYIYVIGGQIETIKFEVDPANEKIIPVNDISRWAFWSVTPRT